MAQLRKTSDHGENPGAEVTAAYDIVLTREELLELAAGRPVELVVNIPPNQPLHFRNRLTLYLESDAA